MPTGMLTSRYRFVLEVLGEDGRSLERSAIAPDWRPALEWVRFEGVREGRLPAVTSAAAGLVEPVWHGRAGAPWVPGFRIAVPTAGDGAVVREVPTS